MKLRFIVAGLIGVVVAFASVAGIEALGHAVYPPPADLDFSNANQVRAFMDALPLGALLLVLGSWISGTFLGGLVAALIARSRPYLFAGIVGAFVLAATIANLLLIPHPLWLTLLALAAIPLAAFLAGALGSKRAAT